MMSSWFPRAWDGRRNADRARRGDGVVIESEAVWCVISVCTRTKFMPTLVRASRLQSAADQDLVIIMVWLKRKSIFLDAMTEALNVVGVVSLGPGTQLCSIRLRLYSPLRLMLPYRLRALIMQSPITPWPDVQRPIHQIPAFWPPHIYLPPTSATRPRPPALLRLKTWHSFTSLASGSGLCFW